MQEMKDRKQLVVSAIKDGTVIDHIPAKALFKVIDILGLDHIENQITFGTNLDSKKLGKKGIMKLSGVFFKQEDLDRIALVAPDVKVNIIRDYQVAEKKVVEIPEKIHGIVKCVNPMCITNQEEVKTKFDLMERQPVSIKCHYCEKVTDSNSMEIIT
jgi:aspartate carbamoyltransferase regulatory subunit